MTMDFLDYRDQRMIRMKVIKDPTDIKFGDVFDLRFRFVIKILRFDHERLYLEFQI